MATTAYATGNALAVKAWAKRLWAEGLKETRYAQFRGSTGSDSLVQMKTEVSKGPGDRVTQGLRVQLTGAGIQGDSTLEGNEEAVVTHSDNVFIDQLRHATRSSGKMSEQRVAFDVREEMMAALRDWLADRLDTWMFNQLGGATVRQVTTNGTVAVQADTRYSGNQAAVAQAAARYFTAGAGLDTTDASLSASTTFAISLREIDRAVAKAKTLSPMVRPLKMNGESCNVMFIHPNATYQLRTQTATGQWGDIEKAKLQGGKIGDNPLITGLLGRYNNTLLVEDARLPTIQGTPNSGTYDNYRQGLFCGAQAGLMGLGRDSSDTNIDWVEEEFDYGNQLGVSIRLIAGLKKAVFNSADFGVLGIGGYAPAV